MVDKLEAGKTYRLVDEEGYVDSHDVNAEFLREYAHEGCLTLDFVSGGWGFICDGEEFIYVISRREAIFFEEVVSTVDEEVSEGMSPIEEFVEQTMIGLEEAGVAGGGDTAPTINGNQVGHVETETGSPCERTVINQLALNMALNMCLKLSVEDAMDGLLSAWALQGNGYMECVGFTDKSVIVTGECEEREMFTEAWRVFGNSGMKVVFVDMEGG